MPRRDTHWPNGTPCWVDLATTDPAAARDFYVELFGWRFELMGDTPDAYAIAYRDGAAVAAVSALSGSDRPAWLTYLAHDDVDAAAVRIDRAGGTIVFEPSDVGTFGRMLVATDVTGSTFGVWQANEFIGAEVVNEPGTLVWNELLTTSHRAALDFYREVFDVSFTDIGGDAFTFATMEVAGNTVGGIGELADDLAQQSGGPFWRMYFAAADTDASLATARRHGAAVTLPAHDSPFGRWGSLADPQGAAFSVITPPR